MLLEDNPFMEGNLRTLDWMKGSIILGLVGLLLGCATSEDVQILDSDVYQLKSQIHKVEKESDSLKKEIELYQRETQKGFPVLQAETKRLQSNLSLQLENLQSDLQAETKKLQSNLSLQLENLQSELKVIQKEKDILQNGLIVLQKEVQRDISTLQNMDNLLRTDLTKETQKLHADLILHFQTLQSEIQKFSIGVEEYKEFLMKVSRETDRLRKDITLRTELLEGSKKTLEEKNKAQDDQTKVLNERVKGMDDRSKGLEDRSKGLEDRSKGLEGRSKGLEERSKGLEDRSKGLEERSKSLEDRIKGMDEKIGRVVSKQGELEKSISAKEVSIGVKGFTTGAGDLYKEAYESFQKGDLEGAQKKLEAFLKQYPNTELSDNAQFWIGETYYLKKDFEKAILEYEKAIAKYPEGDKIPAALFKQALAFLELGDKTNAKSLLKRVIERYPHSDQAEIAKKKLEEIK